MSVIEALVLGAIQGITEFLPVSSTGHLVIFQHIFGLKEGNMAFDVFLHLGTLLAVVVAFREDIMMIIRKPFNRLTYLIIIGCVPAGLIGFLFKSYFERTFESLLIVGFGLVLTGIILKGSEYLANKNFGLKKDMQTSYRDVLFIGIMQAIAIIPGISRSGSTIAGGLIVGLEREFAARYSFLLSIPVILGAGILEIKDIMVEGLDKAMLVPYIVGPIAAAIFGYLAIRVVMGLVRQGRLSIFAYYCWTVAAFVFINQFFFH